MTSAATRLSLDDFLAMPEDEKPYREFLRGEVTEKAMPNPQHGRLCARLILRLGAYLERTGEGEIETEVRHADRDEDWVYLPDISINLGLAAPQARGAVESSSDFAIEVLSPDDRAARVMERVDLYMAAGAQLLWLVDPERRVITAYRPGQPLEVWRPGDVATARPVLRDFELDVGQLFAVLDGPPATGEAVPPRN